MRTFRTIQHTAILVAIVFCTTTLTTRRLPTTLLRPPRLSVVIVVDAFGYHYMQKLMPYFNYGFKVLLDKGVVYTNAYWPHGTPSTGPGHTALNTGVYGKDSGIVANSWFDGNGKKVECDDDLSEKSAVFAPDGFYDYGKSPCNTMVPGVSDSLAMQAQPCANTKVFSISLKSRAAIGMAGKNKRNLPIWFDPISGNMTSSNYYCDILPEWVQKFKKTNTIVHSKSLCWDLLYPADSDYYCFDGIKGNDSARTCATLIGESCTDTSSESPYNLFEKTPMANQMLFDCAKACIKANLGCNRDDRMVLWLSLSPLDKLAHVYGPQSLEVTDLLYQLDYQIKCFIHFVDRCLKRSDVLYVLTADHGMGPIPEKAVEQGYPAHRQEVSAIQKEINEAIAQKLGKPIKSFIRTPNVYFSKEFDQLDKKEQQQVRALAKEMLLKQHCVKNVWTYSELAELTTDDTQVESFFKNQRFAGRSGQLIVQTAPFCQLTKYSGGTTHEGPYECNTHVPLIIYRHEFFEHKMVNTKTSMLQFANTLAQILHIPKAAASTFGVLPGLFPAEQDFVL